MSGKLSKREKSLLYLLLCLSIVAGMVALLILPALNRNLEAQDTLSQLQTQQMEMQIQKDRLPGALETLDALDVRCSRLYATFFTARSTSEALDLYITRPPWEPASRRTP